MLRNLTLLTRTFSSVTVSNYNFCVFVSCLCSIKLNLTVDSNKCKNCKIVTHISLAHRDWKINYSFFLLASSSLQDYSFVPPHCWINWRSFIDFPQEYCVLSYKQPCILVCLMSLQMKFLVDSNAIITTINWNTRIDYLFRNTCHVLTWSKFYPLITCIQ